MSELSYPRFPLRAFVVIGAVLAAFFAAAIVASSGGGPSLRGCAVAAERVMAAHGYSADLMELDGPRAVRACRGLTGRQYAQALRRTYRIEYGGRLPRQPLSHDVPPAAYKSLSARSGIAG
ncbi:MAG TPA: hypothetical protein VF834_05130 [Streptosporangiaceae bacterium]